ncbi:MAG TPA: response regulator [Allosphingosinicella sp.]|jgi:two-component system OmpR family response regulator
MDRPGTAPGELILLVDDDPEIRQLIGDFLVQHGFRVALAADGAEMDRRIGAERPALVVLDLMMPGEDGLAICRRLRASGRIPVIMLSALGEETDRIVGLELGADDYLPKPCSPRELLARVRAVLRRREGAEPAGGGCYHFAGWSFDTRRRELRAPGGVAKALSSGEFRLLTAFVERPQRVLTRDQLLDLARGPSADVFDRAIDVQVSRLRKKLTGADGADLIATVRSEGYMFVVRPVLR